MNEKHLDCWLSFKTIDKKSEYIVSFWNWLNEFIAEPNILLTRPGAVCPYFKPALKKDNIYLYISSNNNPSPKDLFVLLSKQCDQYIIHEEHFTKPSLLCLIVLFPFWKNGSFEILKEARITIKPYFLDRGITLGEFYPGNPDLSVWSDNLRIADSPQPAIVIRSLAQHDELFLNSQPDLFAYYLRKFPGK